MRDLWVGGEEELYSLIYTCVYGFCVSNPHHKPHSSVLRTITISTQSKLYSCYPKLIIARYHLCVHART